MRTMYVDLEEKLKPRKLKRIAKKLYRRSKKEDIVVALSKYLENNFELRELLQEYGLKVLDGRWLFKFFLCDIIENIAKLINKKQEFLVVALFMEGQDEIIFAQLMDIAKKVKTLKIISNSSTKFDFLERNLYEEYGIAIQVTNNKRKSLSNVDVIINFDWSEEKLNEYNVSSSAVLVSINGNISNFRGISIDNYKIEYNKENFVRLENEENFNENVLYESYIYRRDTFENLKNQLKMDNVRLTALIDSRKM